MRKQSMMSSLSALYAGPRWASARPDILRREALLFNTLLMLGAVALAYPFAVYLLVTGAYMPVVLASAGLALSALALTFHFRRAFEWELACQVTLIASTGIALTLADPDILDFGLAVVLMATLMALLVSNSRFKHVAWLAPIFALAVSILGNSGHLPNPFGGSGQDASVIAIAAYATAILIIGVTANRLNTTASASARTHMKTFSMLVESVRDAVVRYGADGDIVFLSKSAARLCNCQRYELDGQGFLGRVHVMDRPAYLTAISDATRRGLAVNLDIRMRRDGEAGTPAAYIWVELGLSPVIDDADQQGPWEVVGVLRDVSGRKGVETALEKARKDAEDSSFAKSRFLATVGHELRTPLNAIVGFSDMIHAGIGGTPSPQHQEYAGLISQSGHHLLEVVNMLLDMSKIEAGKFEVQTDLFAPEALVDPCVQIVEKSASDRGIAIVASIPEQLPGIVADERACRQVLINLLSNAVKFSHDGGTVKLDMKRQGRMLLITVCDEGIGMQSETVRRIGEPFLQAQDGLARRYEGTGLGLSIVKGLVALHEGRLDIVSAPGEGTTVAVLLPLDGPGSTPTAEITPIRPIQTGTDEEKWLEDEKRSAAR